MTSHPGTGWFFHRRFRLTDDTVLVVLIHLKRWFYIRVNVEAR